MTTTELLLLALVGAVLLVALLVVATRRKASAGPSAELTVADRLSQMQAAVSEALARATKEMADQRAASADQVRKLEVSLADQKLAAVESQRKQETAFLERMAKFEKGLHESVTAAKKEVTTSKEAIDKNAADMAKVMASLGETLGKLSTQQEAATRISEDLKFVLQGTKSRGDFGETILEELLERTVPGIWKPQVVIESREAVDAVVFLKDTIYPIDAKFPKEDYQRFLRADTDGARAEAWKAHAGAVKLQVDSIARKYVKPEAGTAQFALMFIPSEGMYYDTLRDTDPFGARSGLTEYAYSQHVIPVGPTTLFAFLMVIAKAQEGQRLVEGVHELMTHLDKVRRSFDLFYTKYEAMGRGIDKAHEAWRVGDNHIQRFKDNVEQALEYDATLLPIVKPALPLENPVGEPSPANLVRTTERASALPEPLVALVPTSGPEGNERVAAETVSASLPAKRNKAAFKVED